MIRNYFVTAWRNISRNKLYTAINVSGLALGICACLIIYLITSFELSFDTFHPDRDRIYRIVGSFIDPHGKPSDIGGTIGPMPGAMRNELSGFEDVVTFNNLTVKTTIPNGKKEPRKFDAPNDFSPLIVTEPQYFNLFRYTWLAGDAKTSLTQPFKVVLTQSEAYKYFGDIQPHEAIGREVIYGDSLRVTVSGIVRDLGENTDFRFKDFLSFATVNAGFLKHWVDMKNWGMWDYNTQGYVKLAKGVTPAQVERQLPRFVKAHIPMPPGFKTTVLLQPLADVHFNSIYSDTYTRKAHLPTLYGLMGIAAFILIIAAINFINLSTAQSLRRAKEVGVRKTLGGSKASLTVQFLIETFMVTTAAVLISVVIANPVIAAFHSIIPPGVSLRFSNPLTWVFLTLVTTVTALLAGFYPARVLASYLPALTLKGQGSQKLNGRSYLRKALIIFQFTVSLVFIIGTVVVADQVHYVLNKDLGFSKDAIITTRLGWSVKAYKVDVFINKIKQLDGVSLISKHRITPQAFGHPSTYVQYVHDGGNRLDASFETCDEHYVPLYGLKVIAGRNLQPSDTLREFLINETCAKALGFKNPVDAIGKVIMVGINDHKGPIAGVLKDFHSESLHEPISPFFICSQKDMERTVSIKLATTGRDGDKLSKILAGIEQAAKEVYPNEKFEFKFFDETIAQLYQKEQKTSQLMNIAMLIAVLISCMGLFGLATFTAQQRIKEIGIRKVLGATPARIVSMLSQDFLRLVALAILIASPIAWYLMHLWLQDFAYRVSISWWIFAGSGLAAIMIALITISFQSVKAALANPAISLKSE